jgi:hypothetical protein
VAGGAARGGHKGYGFTLAVNNINRTTLALIGENTDSSSALLAGEYNVASLDVEAETTGALVSVGFAAAASAPSEPPTNNLAKLNVGSFLSVPFLRLTPSGTSGVGAAGDVGVNVVQSKTEAYLNDAGTFTVGGDVTVKATSDTPVMSIAGAIGLSQQPAGDNTGVGGSFAANVLLSTTEAFVSQVASLSADHLTVSALHDDTIVSLTAGGAGATPSTDKSDAIAGSVSVNLILPETLAYLANDAQVSLVADSSVTAREESEIGAVAGAAALGGSGGYGVSVGVNILGAASVPTLVPDQPNLPAGDGVTDACVTGSTITMVGGTFTVEAVNANSGTQERIIAITGSLGVGSEPQSKGIAGMLSVNLIRDDTEAYVSSNSSITEVAAPSGVTDPGPLNLVVHAQDASGIVSIGGAVGAGQRAGVGVALGYNEIHSTIRADLD